MSFCPLFCCIWLEAHGLVDRNCLEVLTSSIDERDDARTKYVDITDAELTSATRIMEDSSAAWTEEQRKFRELADVVHMVGETVEHHASGLSDVSGVLRCFHQTLPRLPTLTGPAPHPEQRIMTHSQTIARPFSLEV